MDTVIYGAPKCRYFHQTGAAYECKPHLPHAPASGILPWNWFPWKLRISTPVVLYSVAGLLVAGGLSSIGRGIFMATTGLGRQVAGLIVLGLFLFLVGYVFYYFGYIMVWNFRLREAICWAQGKSVQAQEMWKLSGSLEKAKLIFFKTNVSKNVEIRVLRDGSQELWNTSGGEFNNGLSKALSEAGFQGKIFDAAGAVNVSHANTGMADKRHPDIQNTNDNEESIV